MTAAPAQWSTGSKGLGKLIIIIIIIIRIIIRMKKLKKVLIKKDK